MQVTRQAKKNEWIEENRALLSIRLQINLPDRKRTRSDPVINANSAEYVFGSRRKKSVIMSLQSVRFATSKPLMGRVAPRITALGAFRAPVIAKPVLAAPLKRNAACTPRLPVRSVQTAAASAATPAPVAPQGKLCIGTAIAAKYPLLLLWDQSIKGISVFQMHLYSSSISPIHTAFHSPYHR